MKIISWWNVFFYGQPLPVSRRSWQILLRKQCCPIQCLLTRTWLAFLHSPVISAQVGSHASVRAHARTGLFMWAFPPKSQWVMEQIAMGRPRISPLLPAKVSSGTAELPPASIFLMADKIGEAADDSLLYSFLRVNLPPVQRSKYELPGWKKLSKAYLFLQQQFYNINQIICS